MNKMQMETVAIYVSVIPYTVTAGNYKPPTQDTLFSDRHPKQRSIECTDEHKLTPVAEVRVTKQL
jgi:hypothetical protein